MRDLRERRTFYQQVPTLLSNMSRAVARMSRSHPYRRAARTLGTVFLPLDFLLQPMLRPLSHSQRMNQSRRKRRNAEEALAFDASYKPFKQQKNMKEELLEAIYGTVERLEQKVDELSASPKNTEAESTPVSVSVNISKLEKAILAMAVKEGESIDKLARLREAICIFTDLTKKEASNGEQRSKLLFDAINQVKQELNATSKNVQEKLHAMGNTPLKKVVTHRFEPTSKYVLLFIGGLTLSLVLSIWGNLTQWRAHQDWEEADLKYRALKMVLPSDDPNVRYIEKNFSVCPNKEVIENVRTRVNIYEDSNRYHNEMIQMAAIKDSMANSLFKEANEIKKKINQK